MKKYILVLFLVGFLWFPVSSFAQPGDVDPNPPQSSCVNIVNNLRYRDRDVNTNGEVSTLQDFLQAKGYLNSEPTGYFGLLTLQASKDFQNANNITPTGYVGPITRGKIKDLTCSGTIPPNNNNPVISGVSGPQSLNVNQTGTWTVNASSQNGGNLSYFALWGDQCPIIGDNTCVGPRATVQQSATFTHSYSQPGTYTAIFTVTSGSTIMCVTTPCPSNGGSTSTKLIINVGGTISTLSINLVYPVGGETLVAGGKTKIKWETSGISKDEKITALFYSHSHGVGGTGSDYSAELSLGINDGEEEIIVPVKADGDNVNFADLGTTDLYIRVPGVFIWPQVTCPSGTTCMTGPSHPEDRTSTPLKIISSPNNSPTISGVSGPQTLNVNQTGTWTINASDPNVGNLSYSVNWGDEMTYASGRALNYPQFPVQQSATFTHNYLFSGTFAPTFTVTNNNGQSATTSLSVRVGNIIYPYGCDSYYGFSTTTGQSCGILLPGCSSNAGYSLVNGKSCSPFPPGCNSTVGYSETTGQACWPMSN